MHGEYKTPGGKLVRVDFDVRDGGLRDIVVSGDFFLYPDEALSDITGSLDGLSPDLSEVDLVERISAAIPSGTEWLGSSPEALAIAVRRAITEAKATNV
jgi:lipoate-protein ligase A